MATKTRGLSIATRYASASELVERLHRFCDASSLFLATRDTREIGTQAPFVLRLADQSTVLRGACLVLEAWATADNRFGKPGVRLELQQLTPASRVIWEQIQAARAGVPANAAVATPSITSRIATIAMAGSGVTGALPVMRGMIERPEVLAHAARAARSEKITVAFTPPMHELQRRPITVRIPALKVPLPPLAMPLPAPQESAGMAGGVAIIRSAAVSVPVVVEARPARKPLRRTGFEIAVGTPSQRAPGSALVLPANPLMDLTDESLRGFVDCRLYEELAAPTEPEPPTPPKPPKPPAPPKPVAAVTERITLPPPPAPEIRWSIVVATALVVLSAAVAVGITF